MICNTCEFLQRVEAGWGTCLKSPPDKCEIALFLPEVNCPIGRHQRPLPMPDVVETSSGDARPLVGKEGK